MENQKQNWNRDDVETSLSKIASSIWKMQLGINSIRDEIRQLVDMKAEEMGKEQNPRSYDNNG